MLRASARPSPVPPGLPLTLRSKIRGASSGGTPLPSSRTSITTDLGVSEVRITTLPGAVHQRVVEQRGDHLGQHAGGHVWR